MPHALQFVVFTFAGWLNRHQEDLIDYLREENRVLREQLGSRPVRRWYRRLIAKKYDGSARRRRGRPMTPRELAELVVRMAVENPRWAYTRIRDPLANLGHQIADASVDC